MLSQPFEVGRESVMAEQEELDAEHARQGITLHRMRYVLGFGLLGAGAALLVAWVIFQP
jgi:hypothetical protein